MRIRKGLPKEIAEVFYRRKTLSGGIDRSVKVDDEIRSLIQLAFHLDAGAVRLENGIRSGQTQSHTIFL